MATVNLNKNASALIGENQKVRIRANAGVLEIRPTNRVSETGLPKGEKLINLRFKSQGGNPGATRGIRFTLPSEIAAAAMVASGANFEFDLRKHGWVALVGCEKPVVIPGKAQPAGGSISDK